MRDTDFVTLEFLSKISNLLYPGCTFDLQLVEQQTGTIQKNIKNDTEEVQYWGEVPFSSRSILAYTTSFNIKVIHPAKLSNIEKNFLTKTKNIERFIVTSLITGQIGKNGLDANRCKLRPFLSNSSSNSNIGFELYRFDINSTECSFYYTPSDVRKALFHTYQQAKNLGFEPNWDVILLELGKARDRLQHIYTLKASYYNKDMKTFLNIGYDPPPKEWNISLLTDSLAKTSLTSTSDNQQHRKSSAETRYDETLAALTQQFGAFTTMLEEEQSVKKLSASIDLKYAEYPGCLRDLLTKFLQEENLSVVAADGRQDFIVWCREKGHRLPSITQPDQLIDPLAAAVEWERKIEGKDPIVWGLGYASHPHRDEKKIDGKYISLWAVENKTLIEEKEALEWLALKEFKLTIGIAGINKKDVVSYAESKGLQIRGKTPTKWLAECNALTKWEGKDKYRWLIEQWLDRSSLIDGFPPVTYCINNKIVIEGKDAIVWLKANIDFIGTVALSPTQKNSALTLPDSRTQTNLAYTSDNNSINSIASPNSSITVNTLSSSSYNLAGRSGQTKCITERIIEKLININLTCINNHKFTQIEGEDSIVWMMKNLNTTGMVLNQLDDALSVSIPLHPIDWLKTQKKFDYIQYALDNPAKNIQIDGLSVSDWLSNDVNNPERREQHRNITYTQSKIWKKYYGFETAFHSLNGDFWQAIDSLRIEDLSLATLLIDEVERGKYKKDSKEEKCTKPGNNNVPKPQHIFSAYQNSVNGFNRAGLTPLHVCLSSLQIVRLLVEGYDADVNMPVQKASDKEVAAKQNNIGDTPAFCAAVVGNLEVLKYLKSKGANLNVVNKRGQNILQCVVLNHIPKANRDLYKTAEFLLDEGLDPITAITIAEKEGHSDLIALFKGRIACTISSSLENFANNMFGPNRFPITRNDPSSATNLIQNTRAAVFSNLQYLQGSIINWNYIGNKCGLFGMYHQSCFALLSGPYKKATEEMHYFIQDLEKHDKYLPDVQHINQLHYLRKLLFDCFPVPHVRFPNAVSTSITIIEDYYSPTLLYTVQEEIDKIRAVTVSLYEEALKVKASSDAKDFFSIIKDKLSEDGYTVCNTINHFLIKETQKFIAQLNTEKKIKQKQNNRKVADSSSANPNPRYDDTESFRLLVGVVERLSGIQILNGKIKSNIDSNNLPENVGWRKKLEKEREQNKDRIVNQWGLSSITSYFTNNNTQPSKNQ